MDDQKCGEFQTRVLGKKWVETNNSVLLPWNGYHSLVYVFHILHNLPLYVALRSEAKFLTQGETSDQLYHVIFTRHFGAFGGKFHLEVYQFLGLSCRLIIHYNNIRKANLHGLTLLSCQQARKLISGKKKRD